jgi:hypothetical protein
MEHPRIKKPSIRQAGTFTGKAVRLSSSNLMRTTRLDPARLLPLVVEPAVEEIDACDWAASNREFTSANLSKHGGLLLRDFKVRTPGEFERFIKAVGGELLDYSYRSTPRTRVNGNVFTSTEYPADQFIPLHNEMSYSRHWPMKIFFFACSPPGAGVKLLSPTAGASTN